MENIEPLWVKFYDAVMTFGPRLIGALIVLAIGWWIIKIIQRSVKKGFEKHKMEPSLRGFLNSITGVTLKIMLLISVIGMLGVEMTSFIAILAAVGLAIGMALSGTLQNFAGGVMLLLFKPFKA
ncbi:MAG: mechanosensitive ion channel family protein, partial [Tangfeifania sp.]